MEYGKGGRIKKNKIAKRKGGRGGEGRRGDEEKKGKGQDKTEKGEG